MAGKSSDKSSKTTSSKKNTGKTASTVTPIDASKGGEKYSRVQQSTDILAVEQKSSEHKTLEHKSADHKAAHHEIAEQIRVRAYELFEQRGRYEGHDHEDWVRAEAEILLKYQRGKSA
jgi:Protein of unknown function (DUF2934)